jgi:hypothetical protein
LKIDSTAGAFASIVMSVTLISAKFFSKALGFHTDIARVAQSVEKKVRAAIREFARYF